MRNLGVVVLALWMLGCGGKHKPGDLKVTGTPTGHIDGELRMVLAFSRAMVKKDHLGIATSAPIVLTPALAHEARWTDDKTLVVVPTTSLPLSTKYTAVVPGETKALDGSELGVDTSFEFFTERLTATAEAIGPKNRAAKDQLVRLSFNQQVTFDEVAAQCAYTAKSGDKKVKLAPKMPAAPGRTFAVVPDGDLALDTDWVFRCKAGLKGVVGNLGIEAAAEEKFHTYGPLKFVAMDPSGNDIVPDEKLRLQIELSNPLAEPFKLSIVPAVAGFPQGCHVLVDAPAGVSCSGQFEAQTKYTITIDGAQKDVFGQTLGKPQIIEFRTTDAKPTISLESGYFVGELKRPVVPLWTRNVTEIDVTAVAITQANFHELAPLLDWWGEKTVDFTKTKLLKPTTKKLTITGKKNEWGQHSFDPTEVLGGTPGPGMYYVEFGSPEVQQGAFENGGKKKVLVNFTDIGVVSKLSPTRGLVWATKLSTGKPLPGATVTVRDQTGKQTWTGTTDASGIATLPGIAALGAKEEGFDGLRVYVQSQADWTMINPSATGGLSTWAFNITPERSVSPVQLRGFMHTDRGLYRPGDKVHVKGLARVTSLGAPLSLPAVGKKVEVEVDGPQGKAMLTTTATLSAFGGFWFDIDLPGDARLGDYNVVAKLEHGTFTRSFSVEEYRPATFEVTGSAKEPLLISRGDIHATVAANYFYGAPVRNGSVDVSVHSRKRRVSFDKLPDFDFGDDRNYESYYMYESDDAQTMVTEDHVALDAKGNGNFSFSIGRDEVATDADLLVQADVHAPSNEVISKSFTIPYFRSKRYFGIKSPGYFLDVKKPQKFEIISVSPDGKVVDGPAKVKVTRRDWNCVWEDWGYRGSYQCKDTEQTLLDKPIQISGGKPAEIEFTPPSGGDYLVVVEGENEKAEVAPAAQNLYAWGDGGGSWKSDDTLKFDIAMDKQEYKAGDTANLILKTDLANATGLVTIERDGVIEQRLIDITPTTKRVQVPITAAYAPNIYVSVALIQGRTGDGPRGKPRMRMGIANLTVRPQDNRLTVSVESDKKSYKPGEQVTATVKVLDGQGKPVSAEVSITAADEGVLSLIAYKTPDPVATFYAPWGLGVTSATQLEYIRDIPAPNIERPATGGDSVGTVRSRFVASAVWVPGAVTDANGVATVTFAAPDNLTAFRMMAVAADNAYRFGSADKRFTVSKPLQLHSALPRFVSLGDSLQGGVVVHNETGKPGNATVKIQGDEHVTIPNGAEKTVAVPAGGRIPVMFDLTPAATGTASLTFSVAMNNETDAVKLELPVKHPGFVKTADLDHGVIKGAKTVSVKLPADAVPASAELIVSVDPDGLSGIEDGLGDLIGYPYGCMEQTTSKMVAMIAVRDLAESLAIDGLTGDKLDGFVKAGIMRINKQQTAYGGFSLWPDGEPNAFYTAYGLWGLYLAKQAGYPVDSSRIDEALAYLANDGLNPDKNQPVYSEMGNLAAQAFAAYVRALYKDKGAAAVATNLLTEGKLPIYGKVYAARALAMSVGKNDPAVQKVVAELAVTANAATKTEALIHEPDEKEHDYYMSSDTRTTSAVLLGLVELDPKSAAIKPLVQTLMKQRRLTKYWDTHANFYSLLALTTYAKAFAGTSPSVAIQIAGKEVLSTKLAGKQKLRILTLPLAADTEVAFAPQGEVAYNVGVRYRVRPEMIKPESHGIEITREYTDEAGKAKTSFKVGDVVVVKLHVKVPDESTHLMVSDALPAGFEALNTKLATVGAATVTEKPIWWDEDREIHDDRVDFASEYVYMGSLDYEYSIRAIAAGKFTRPPATSQLMYDPKTNANTALDVLEVVAR